jgi:hypothetical protein
MKSPRHFPRRRRRETSPPESQIHAVRPSQLPHIHHSPIDLHLDHQPQRPRFQTDTSGAARALRRCFSDVAIPSPPSCTIAAPRPGGIVRSLKALRSISLSTSDADPAVAKRRVRSAIRWPSRLRVIGAQVRRAIGTARRTLRGGVPKNACVWSGSHYTLVVAISVHS